MSPREALEMGKSFDLSGEAAREVWRSWTVAERDEYTRGIIEKIRLLGYIEFEKRAEADAARMTRLH